MDQDQLAEISSSAIPLEKVINNGKGQRDETSRQRSSVALTMRGSPSFVFPWLTFHRNFKKRTDGNQSRTDSRCSGFAEEPGIDQGNGGEEAVGTNQALGQWPERKQLQNSHCPGQVCDEAPPSCAVCVTCLICQVFLFN